MLLFRQSTWFGVQHQTEALPEFRTRRAVMKYVGNYAHLDCKEVAITRRLLSAAGVFCICLLLAPNLYGWNRYDIIPGARFAAMQSARQWLCSDGWYVTGYYVPREDELPGTSEEIYVERQGNLSFIQNFLRLGAGPSLGWLVPFRCRPARRFGESTHRWSHCH